MPRRQFNNVMAMIRSQANRVEMLYRPLFYVCVSVSVTISVTLLNIRTSVSGYIAMEQVKNVGSIPVVRISIRTCKQGQENWLNAILCGCGQHDHVQTSFGKIKG